MIDQTDLFTPEAKTQKGRILQALERAGVEGICLHDLHRDDAYTCRNRISELRRDGYIIESWTCGRHKHRSSVARYRLVPLWLYNQRRKQA